MSCFLKSLVVKSFCFLKKSEFLINCLKLITFAFNCNFNHALLRLFGLYDNLKILISFFVFPLVGMRLTLEKWAVTTSIAPFSLMCIHLWERWAELFPKGWSQVSILHLISGLIARIPWHSKTSCFYGKSLVFLEVFLGSEMKKESINRWMDKQGVISVQRNIIQPEKERSNDICYNMDKSHKLRLSERSKT